MDSQTIFLVLLGGFSLFAFFFWQYVIDILIFTLVMLLPINKIWFMPREIFGVTGMNLLNVLSIFAFVLLSLELIGRRRPFELMKYLSPPVLAFAVLFVIAGIRTGMDLDALIARDEAFSSFVIERIFKPAQIVFVGYLVWLYCELKGSTATARLAMLVTSIVLAPIVLWLSLTGGDGGGYAAGRANLSKFVGLHANDLAAYTLLLLVNALFSRTDSYKLLRAAAIGSCLLIIGLCFSRMGYTTTLVILALGYWSMAKRDRRFLLVAGATVVIAFSAQITQRIYHGVSEQETQWGAVSSGRIDTIWLPLIPQVLEHPIAGEGFLSINKSEAARSILPRGPKGNTINHPHNAYLEVLIDMGVVGLISLGFLLRRFFRVARFAPEFKFALIAWMCMAITGNSFYPKSSNAMIWIIYAMALSQAKWARRNVKDKTATMMPAEA